MSLKVLPFDEAIKFFKDKVTVPKEVFRELTDEAKVAAFSSVQIARADIMLDVQNEIDRALKQGIAFDTFKKNLIIKEMGWGGDLPYRLDTIFRTNIQTAYNAGHFQQQQVVKDTRPFLEYVAVLDANTRPSHAAQDGKVFPIDHPYWSKWTPPNGFECRCTTRQLSDAEVKREGLKVLSKEPKTQPDTGFAVNPGKVAHEPNLSKYPDWIRKQIEL